MPNTLLSPNMNITVPVASAALGPQWAIDIQSALYTTIDQHNHTPGQGNPIPPTGLNINAPLTFNNQLGTDFKAVTFTPQNTSLTGTNGALYMGNDGNLYFNPGTGGSSAQITSGSTVAAFSSSLQSGTASATFVSGTLVVNADTNVSADIKAGNIFLGNNTAGNPFVELSPPASMTSDYQLTLPLPTATQKFLALDSLGNITAFANTAQGITEAMITPATITHASIAANTILDGNIAVGTITSNSIQNATIGSNKLSSGAALANIDLTSINVRKMAAVPTTTASWSAGGSPFHGATIILANNVIVSAGGNLYGRPVFINLYGTTASYNLSGQSLLNPSTPGWMFVTVNPNTLPATTFYYPIPYTFDTSGNYVTTGAFSMANTLYVTDTTIPASFITVQVGIVYAASWLTYSAGTVRVAIL